MKNKIFLAMAMLLALPLLLFSQTPGLEDYYHEVSKGYAAALGFIFWITADVFHLALKDTAKKVISVLLAAVVGGLIAWRWGFNPLDGLGLFGVITFIIKFIKEITGVTITPGELLGLFKK